MKKLVSISNSFYLCCDYIVKVDCDNYLKTKINISEKYKNFLKTLNCKQYRDA